MSGMVGIDRFLQDGIGVKGNMIKSIQFVELIYGSTTTTTTQTISTAVTKENCIIFQVSGNGRSTPQPRLINSNTIEWASWIELDNQVGVTFVIIEFEAWAVKSSQSGLAAVPNRSSTYPGSSNNVTLATAVDTSKCLITCCASRIQTDADYIKITPVLTSSTNLDLKHYYNGYSIGTWEVDYTVIELI